MECKVYLQIVKMTGAVLAVMLFIMGCTSQTDKMFIAAENGDVQQVQKLLDKGISVNVENENKATPLHYAAGKGQTEMVRLLLANHANPNAKEKDGFMPLHAAVGGGYTAIVKLLIDKGADINAPYRGISPVDAAIRGGHGDVADLLKAKASPAVVSSEAGEQKPEIKTQQGTE